MVGGATLTGFRNISLVCAWASVAYLVDSILNDQKKMIACSVLLKGVYEKDICIGVPCIIGKMVLKKLLRLS
jgi:malate dehydrogenase